MRSSRSYEWPSSSSSPSYLIRSPLATAEPSGWSLPILLLLDAFNLIDVLATFLTAFTEYGTQAVVTDPRKIAMHYLCVSNRGPHTVYTLVGVGRSDCTAHPITTLAPLYVVRWLRDADQSNVILSLPRHLSPGYVCHVASHNDVRVLWHLLVTASCSATLDERDISRAELGGSHPHLAGGGGINEWRSLCFTIRPLGGLNLYFCAAYQTLCLFLGESVLSDDAPTGQRIMGMLLMMLGVLVVATLIT